MAKKRYTIGVCGIADFRNIMGQSNIAGIYDAAKKLDMNIINFCGATKYSVSDDFDLYNYYPKVFKFLNSSNIDGLISWASSLGPFLSTEKLINLHKSLDPLPIVGIGTPILPDTPGIYTDNNRSIGYLMDHLIKERGCRRVAFLGVEDQPDYQHYQNRLNAYCEWLASHHLPCDRNLIFISKEFEPGHISECVEKLISAGAHKPPLAIDGLITVSDIVAKQAIEIFLANGIRVPEDIAVAGFNNQIEGRDSKIPITTVDPNFYQKSYRAVELLHEIITNPSKNRIRDREYFPPTLVIRQSSGTFEDIIVKAGAEITTPTADFSQSDLEQCLYGNLDSQALTIIRDSLPELCRALKSDMEDSSKQEFLTYIRENFTTTDIQSEDYNNSWQNMISDLRRIIIDRINISNSQRYRMENIFHQARVLISVFDSYFLFSKRFDVYKFNFITKIAIDFSFAEDGQQLMKMLGQHIEDLGIPGVVLVLQDEMYSDIGDGRIALQYPLQNTSYQLNDEKEIRVSTGTIPVKTLRGKHNGRFIYIMKILYHKGQFMGFALLENGPLNFAMYDLICILLSRALYGNYLKLNRILQQGEIQALIKTRKLKNILYTIKEDENNNEVSTNTILDYLVNNIGEKTNVPKMAADLGLSESSLMKKTKKFTGYSLQTLHEMLKIERAKILLSRNESSIGQLAIKLGFNNQSYFARVFRKHTGFSPRNWGRDKKSSDVI